MITLHVAVDESTHSLRGVALGELLNRQLDARLVLTSVAEQMDKRRLALQERLGQAGFERYRDDLSIEQGDDAARVLARLAAASDESLLCMTSHGRRPAAELFLGSVAAATVRQANALVVLGGPRFEPNAQARIDTLMVCVDGSPLAESVLPQAVALARALGASLQLLNVVSVEPSSASSALPPGLREVDSREPGGHADVMESAYLHGLARRIREVHRFEADWEVLHGYEPAEALVGYLADQPNAMAVMTTHGRSGLSQLAAGSVSHEVLHEAACPVAVMRPSATIGG
ncbi:universal stress protein [Halomonas beimenensis]|uniref:universal stress protein n=1 Tax=Halomonas beimenensis TaxID=475662 RepID=UPI0031DBE788